MRWRCEVTLPDLGGITTTRFDTIVTVLSRVEDEHPEVTDSGMTASPGDGLTIAMVVTGPESVFTAIGVAARVVRAVLGQAPGDHWRGGPRVHVRACRDDDSEEAAA